VGGTVSAVLLFDSLAGELSFASILRDTLRVRKALES
jgi:hypothetical protein